ncbi:putative amidase [Aspergillus lucknowensis]|uniref:Amidase signature domain-containing protein n=1 Tax=Aspergillus lucknowensis TaxID=176173 RepID=A0ABR4LMW0_9EURO
MVLLNGFCFFFLLLYTALGDARLALSACAFPSLIDATQSDLQTGLRLGCFSSVDLTYTRRINEVNSKLNAVLEVDPYVLRIAEQLDLERKRGRTSGPLHGLPILVKDLIGTDDVMETADGSYALVGAKVAADATVVMKLRDNGAIILGKTNPLGNSSGSAVATDLGLVFASLGTETSGSIISPSEKSNIVGIKPTVGLTSRYMVIPVSERQDTVGPMTRAVRDAALILQGIVGEDEKDNYTLASLYSKAYPNYVTACNETGLQGKRIGIPGNVIDTLGGPTEQIISSFEEAVDVIEKLGAAIIEDTNFTAYEDFQRSQIPQRVVAADMLSGISTYLASLTRNPNDLHSLSDIRNFTQRDPQEGYPSRDTDLWDVALFAGMNNTSPDFWTLYQQALSFGEEGGLLGALSRNNLDAVILPSCLAGDIPGILGTPVITVPFGALPVDTAVRYNGRGDLIETGPGIPLGISFLGPKWSEESLVAMAYAFEQRTLTRKALQRVVEPRTELLDLQHLQLNQGSCLREPSVGSLKLSPKLRDGVWDARGGELGIYSHLEQAVSTVV